MIVLEAEHLNKVQSILQRIVPHYEVWAFGSRVTRRRVKPFSDLDLVLMTDSPLDISLYGKIKEAFSESDLPIRVDIVDWCLLNDRFKEMIRKEHERIQ